MNSTTKDSPPCSSTFVSNPLNVDIVAEEILSYLALGDEEQLLNYRLVSHKWNDIIVKKFNKSGRRFPISLRYDHQVPKPISQSVSKRSANRILDSAIRTLEGTAARLTFDTIVVGRGFYLAHGVMTKWKELLKIQGKCIHHFKLHCDRSGESTDVEDCEELISMNCLRATFSAIPALETLDISVEFTNSNQQLFPTGHVIPRLENLTKITILGTRRLYSGVEFMKDIFSMAPNLSTFYSKSSSDLAVVAIALNAQGGRQRVTTIGIDNGIIQRGLGEIINGMFLYHHQQLPFFQLTTLELNNIFCEELVLSRMWITELLRSHSSTLVKLVLGTRKNNSSEDPWLMHPLGFIPIMTALKILEINLTKFVVFNVASYDTKFPVLQSLTLTGGHIYGKGWNMVHLGYLLPGQNGQSNTLQEFSLISRPLQQSIKNEILPRIYSTFPMAEYHFDS